MSKPGGTLTFTYDADGNRTSKTVNGVTTIYTYVDGRVTHETNGTDTIHYRYDANGTLLSIHQHELIPHVRGLLHPRADGVRGGVVRLLLAEPAAAVGVAVIHDGLYARDGILPPQCRRVKIRVLGGRRRQVLFVFQAVGDVARGLVVVIWRLERVVIAARAQRLEGFRPRVVEPASAPTVMGSSSEAASTRHSSALHALCFIRIPPFSLLGFFVKGSTREEVFFW